MSRLPARYEQPRSVEEAIRLAKELPGSRFLAGGTDLTPRLKDGRERAEALISLRRIGDLRRIEKLADGYRVGAAVTIAELLEDKGIGRAFPILKQALELLGSAQIRSVATLCGNLANAASCADSAPPLLVLEANARVQGSSGSRDIPLRALGSVASGPRCLQLLEGSRQNGLAGDEILTHIVIPFPEEGSRGLFQKKRRVAMDLALASLAVLGKAEGRRLAFVRLAAGSVAPTPIRLFAVEELLSGSPVDDALLAEAARLARETIAPITDVRAGADYRRAVIGIFVARGVRAIMQGAAS